MGDRGNIVIQYNAELRTRVFFYTHWRGCNCPHILQRALAKRWRWDDDSYLARIIFDEMVKGQEGTETSFGISPFLTDHEYPLVVVDCDAQEVFLEAPDNSDSRSDPISFEAFIALKLGEEHTSYQSFGELKVKAA